MPFYQNRNKRLNSYVMNVAGLAVMTGKTAMKMSAGKALERIAKSMYVFHLLPAEVTDFLML